MNVESEELLAEFKKLQMEANELNQKLQTTTSTLGFSTEAMLLRQVLEELKSVKSEVKEIKTEQENFSKNLGVIHAKVENIETKQIADEEELANVRESLTSQADRLNEKLFETLKTQKEELKVIRDKLNEQQHLDKLDNILGKVDKFQKDVEIVTYARRKAQAIENRQSDLDPILDAIIGSWRYSGNSNSDKYMNKCSDNERRWFKANLKVEVTGRRITMSYPEGPSWTHQIGDPHPKTNLLDNHLVFVYEHAGEVYRSDDFSIKDGKLVRKEMALGVHFERIYERI